MRHLLRSSVGGRGFSPANNSQCNRGASALSFLCALALAAATASAQTIGQNSVSKSGDTFTISVKSQLVVETVTVKDQGLHADRRRGAADHQVLRARGPADGRRSASLR